MTKFADKSLLKHEGTFRQQLLQGGRAEELDPQAVAARCGHMFHRGCLKKLTTELNTYDSNLVSAQIRIKIPNAVIYKSVIFATEAALSVQSALNQLYLLTYGR